MRALSALALVEAWDGPVAETAHARLDRVLRMVVDDEDIANDTLGRRNQRLIALRRHLCGPRPIEAVARCGCGADNEVSIPADAIEAAPVPAPGTRITVEVGGRTVNARPPNMADLAAIAGLADADIACAALLARCTDASNDGGGDDDDSITDPDAVLTALAARFYAMDPAADVRLAIHCVGCGTPLSVVIDFAAFVSRDIGQHVMRLLSEIDCLARAYGWTETAILALPPARRQRYVAMVRGEPVGGIG